MRVAGKWNRSIGRIAVLAAILIGGPGLRAQAPVARLDFVPADMSLDEAVNWALQNNPELATFRAQRGVAAAGVVIARTYPFNPVLTVQPAYVTGPKGNGGGESITSPVDAQVNINLAIEVRHQGRYRREEAAATLSRTDWEIAFQETAATVRIARAYSGALYRGDKLRLLDATAALNRQTSEQVRRLVEQGRLRGADWILARTEIDDTLSQVHIARIALSLAQAELTRSVGMTDMNLAVRGKLEVPPIRADREALTAIALERRPDLQARHAAVQEAQARLRLMIADRFGNPAIGPYYQFDQSSNHFVGGQVSLPIPVLNSKRGEIQQKEAELVQFSLAVRQAETAVRQDVAAACLRFDSARAGVEAYNNEILPHLRESLAGIEKLFAQGEPGVDVLRLIDMRRKSLRADDGYLDALWELAQAHADLAAAAGDPSLVVPCLRSAAGR
jgi:outer membrane protein TolC